MTSGPPLRVLITAGAGGIGRVVAREFLTRGERVHLCDVDAGALESVAKEAHNALVSRCDVADEAQVDALFAKQIEQFGGLDVLVNCAGIAGPTAPIEEITLADWRQCLGVNLDGTLLCSQRAIPIMKQAGAGLIVNFSSTAGLIGYPNRSPYATAKWGIIGFTKTLAMELGPFGIRANAICPGPVEGERIDRVIAAQAETTGRTEAEIRDEYAAGTSLRRFVTPEDIAGTVLFLASPAGASISGQALAVDGHAERI